jgi:hypothetical protein
MKRLMLAILVSTIAGGAEQAPAPSSVRIAVLHEPTMPIVGAGSDPERIARLLAQHQFDVELLSAAQFADPGVLDPSRFGTVIVPTGQSFPAAARANFLRYLRGGGNFVSLGGYAFHHLLLHSEGRWTEESAWLRAKREEALAPEQSLIDNGGFERSVEVPIGGMVLDGQWRRDSLRAEIVAQGPWKGNDVLACRFPPTARWGRARSTWTWRRSRTRPTRSWCG